MSDDLEFAPAEEITVTRVPTADASKIGTKEFVKTLKQLLDSKKNVWRSSKTLTEELGVDALALDKWLRLRPEICSKASSKEGNVLYALVERVQGQTNETITEKKVKRVMARPLVTEQERYAVGILHIIHLNLRDTLLKNALQVAERSNEAFNHLVQAREHLEAGLTLFANRVRTDVRKLPGM